MVPVAVSSVGIIDYHCQDINIHCCGKYGQHSMLDLPIFKKKLHSLTRNISDISESRWCIYCPSIEQSKGGRNIQHSILALHKENTAS